MARIRTIKPEFWDDEKLAALPRDARLLYIGMWNFSDDFGVVKANPIWLKSKVFPFDEIQMSQFKKWLEMLERPGFNSPGGVMAWAIPFNANGETFYYLSNFSRHQRIDKPSTHNRNPEPPIGVSDWKTTIPQPLAEPSPSPLGALPSVLGKEGNGKGIGNSKGKDARDAPLDPWFSNPDFSMVWNGWIEMRKKARASPTELAIQFNLEKLKKLSGDEIQLAIRIIKKSIENNWKGFFELKEGGTYGKSNQSQQRSDKRSGEFAERLSL